MSTYSCQSRTWAELFWHSLHQSLVAGTLTESGACHWCPPVPSPYSAGVADTNVTTHNFSHWDLNSGLGVCAALTHYEMSPFCKFWVLWSSVFHLCCCRALWHFPGTSPFFLGLHYLCHTSVLLELNPWYGLIDLSKLGWIFWEGSWYQDHSEQGRWLYLQAFDVHGTEPKFCSWLKEPSGPGFDKL